MQRRINLRHLQYPSTAAHCPCWGLIWIYAMTLDVQVDKTILEKVKITITTTYARTHSQNFGLLADMNDCAEEYETGRKDVPFMYGGGDSSVWINDCAIEQSNALDREANIIVNGIGCCLSNSEKTYTFMWPRGELNEHRAYCGHRGSGLDSIQNGIRCMRSPS